MKREAQRVPGGTLHRGDGVKQVRRFVSATYMLRAAEIMKSSVAEHF